MRNFEFQSASASVSVGVCLFLGARRAGSCADARAWGRQVGVRRQVCSRHMVGQDPSRSKPLFECDLPEWSRFKGRCPHCLAHTYRGYLMGGWRNYMAQWRWKRLHEQEEQEQQRLEQQGLQQLPPQVGVPGEQGQGQPSVMINPRRTRSRRPPAAALEQTARKLRRQQRR